jgi:hypothetical protein
MHLKHIQTADWQLAHAHLLTTGFAKHGPILMAIVQRIPLRWDAEYLIPSNCIVLCTSESSPIPTLKQLGSAWGNSSHPIMTKRMQCTPFFDEIVDPL